MAVKKHEDPEPKSGQLMRPKPPLPLAARTAKVRTLDRLLSMLSVWPFRNRAFAESLETAANVIKKQTELEETIIGHGKTRAKLNDLGTIIGQDKLQRQRELLEEQRRLSAVLNETMLDGEMVDEKNKLQVEELKTKQMEVAKRKAILKKELEELTKPPPPPPPEPPKKQTTRGRSPKQKLREEVLTKYEKEIARIEASKRSGKAKETLRKAAAAEKEREMAEIEKMP